MDIHSISLSTRIFRKSVEKIEVSLKSEKNNKRITIYIFVISRSVLLEIRNVSDESWRENQNTHYEFINAIIEV
jgi:hypothetical protein